MIHSKIIEIRDLLVEAMGRSVSIWGMNQTLGRLYGLLYFADEPLSLDQMAKELMVSKATISINIRTLEGIKCVQKVWRKGSRKDFYIAERDFEKIFQELMRTNGKAELEIHRAAITQALSGLEELLKEDLSDEVIEAVKKDLERVYQLARWLETGEKWLNFFLEADINEPQAPIRRIDVEWGDD